LRSPLSNTQKENVTKTKSLSASYAIRNAKMYHSKNVSHKTKSLSPLKRLPTLAPSQTREKSTSRRAGNSKKKKARKQKRRKLKATTFESNDTTADSFLVGLSFVHRQLRHCLF
jgi:hypothetical protein